MLSAMRTILEDILPFLDLKSVSNFKSESVKDAKKEIFENSTAVQSGEKEFPSFEFFPHITPKLSDTWDFKARLKGVIFPSSDAHFVSEWTKEKIKMKNITCMNSLNNNCSHCDSNHNNNNCARDNNNHNGAVDDHRDNIETNNDSRILDKNQNTISTQDHSLSHSHSHSSHSTQDPSHSHSSHLTQDPSGSLTIQMGEFTRAYGHPSQSCQFDSVLTSFFIDTAADILEYVAVIAHILRPGKVTVTVTVTVRNEVKRRVIVDIT